MNILSIILAYFRLFSTSKSYGDAQIITQASPGSIWNNLYRTKMKDDSHFGKTPDVVFNPGFIAFFGSIEPKLNPTMEVDDYNHCDYKIVWKT